MNFISIGEPIILFQTLQKRFSASSEINSEHKEWLWSFSPRHCQFLFSTYGFKIHLL